MAVATERTIKISEKKLNQAIDEAIENADFINEALRDMANTLLQTWLKQNKSEIQQKVMQIIAARMPKEIDTIVKNIADNLYIDY